MVPELLGVYIRMAWQYYENGMARLDRQVPQSIPARAQDGGNPSKMVGRILTGTKIRPTDSHATYNALSDRTVSLLVQL